jgi:hypothetical protein
MNQNPDICPECGAALPNGSTCQEIFDSFLALEFENPEYGAVHFFTVACFFIQHNRYSDEALQWMRGMLREALSAGWTGTQIERTAAASVQNTNRRWKILRNPASAPAPKIDWSITIADVARQAGDAAEYRKWVKQWAETVLQEL